MGRSYALGSRAKQSLRDMAKPKGQTSKCKSFLTVTILCKKELNCVKIIVFVAREFRVLVWKSERRRPLGRPRHKGEDNTKMDLSHLEWWGIDWIDLAQAMCRWRAVVSAVMNFRVP